MRFSIGMPRSPTTIRSKSKALPQPCVNYCQQRDALIIYGWNFGLSRRNCRHLTPDINPSPRQYLCPLSR